MHGEVQYPTYGRSSVRRVQLAGTDRSVSAMQPLCAAARRPCDGTGMTPSASNVCRATSLVTYQAQHKRLSSCEDTCWEWLP